MARSIKKGSVVVAVGTKKGGFLFHSPDRKKWSVAGPFMEGGAVYHMILDPRDGRTVYASAPMGSGPWGPAIYRGRAEEEPKATQAFPKFKEGSDLSVSRIWHIEPGPSEAPDTIYAGAEPAALFRSDDRGDTWHDLGSLNYHPTRKEWQPGGGGLCLHSVLVDPRNARHLIVGISAVGAFETRDGTQLDDGEPRRPGGVPPEHVSGVGPVRSQARLGRLRGRLPLPAESLRDLPSRTGRWSVDGSHERTAVRFRVPDRRASEAEAHRVRGTVGRRGEPRLPEGPDGCLEDDEQRQSVAPFDEGFARPGRLPRSAPRRHGCRCGLSDWRLRRDQHGATLCEPRRRRVVEDDQRLPSAHLLRERRDGSVARARR